MYTQVNKDEGDADQELHDLSKESMLGNDLKTTYEKFCFLNGLIEQQLDDPDNLKLLEDKGFKIDVRSDA